MNHQIISISQLIFENLFAKRYSYVLFCVRIQIIIFDQKLLLLLVKLYQNHKGKKVDATCPVFGQIYVV